MGNELLWVFTQLPNHYIVLDTETTGLPDASGPPDIVSIGITVVRNREVAESIEFTTKPQKPIAEQAQAIHGITNKQAAEFEPFDSHWPQMARYLKDQLVVIHNASFDWPILLHHIGRYGLTLPPIQGVFCSQKAAISWAQATALPCSHRGPSLDTLTEALGIESARAKKGGLHGAAIDSQQTAQVVEAMRRSASAPI